MTDLLYAFSVIMAALVCAAGLVWSALCLATAMRADTTKDARLGLAVFVVLSVPIVLCAGGWLLAAWWVS